jgi:hypothetical protein
VVVAALIAKGLLPVVPIQEEALSLFYRPTFAKWALTISQLAVMTFTTIPA